MIDPCGYPFMKPKTFTLDNIFDDYERIQTCKTNFNIVDQSQCETSYETIMTSVDVLCSKKPNRNIPRRTTFPIFISCINVDDVRKRIALTLTYTIYTINIDEDTFNICDERTQSDIRQYNQNFNQLYSLFESLRTCIFNVFKSSASSEITATCINEYIKLNKTDFDKIQREHDDYWSIKNIKRVTTLLDNIYKVYKLKTQ